MGPILRDPLRLYRGGTTQDNIFGPSAYVLAWDTGGGSNFRVDYVLRPQWVRSMHGP